MNIVVCLKQVPGTPEVKINPETNTLIRQGIKSIINPLDTYALEEAVRLREKHGGKVTALTMGPPQADEALREAISLGADAAVLLSDRAFAGADTLATARTLSAGIKKLQPCDLVICGKQTLDGDTGQVAPEMAEMLGLPFVAYVSNVQEVTASAMRLQRLLDDGHELVETPLPAVITVVKEINAPRLPSLRGVMRSKSAVIPTWTAKDIGLAAEEVGLAGSATSVVKIFFPQRFRKAEVLKGELPAQVDCLIEKLRQGGAI